MGRFVPNLVVWNLLRRLGIENPTLERELPKMVHSGLEQIYEVQEDFGWGWFQKGLDYYMTAYVLYGLALTKQMGFEVDEDCVCYAVDGIASVMVDEKNRDLQAYLLFALSEARWAWPKWVKVTPQWEKVARSLAAQSHRLSPMAQAILCIALHRFGLRTVAQQVLAALEKRAKQENGLCWWEGTWGVLCESDVEATAYALKALLLLKPDDPKVTAAALWLMSQRTGNFWYSTKSTAAALFALTDYLARSPELDADCTVRVFVGEKLVHEQRFTKEQAQRSEQRLLIPASAGENAVRLEVNGKGRLYYTVTLHAFVTRGLDKPEGSDLRVQRLYLVRSPKGQWVPLKGSVRPNTEIALLLTVTTKRDLEYVMLEEPLPAGCEVLQWRVGEPVEVPDLPSDWAWTEVHDDRLALFWSFLPEGTHQFSFLLRPEMEGTFTALPTVVQIMYRPQLRGRAAAAGLEVRE